MFGIILKPEDASAFETQVDQPPHGAFHCTTAEFTSYLDCALVCLYNRQLAFVLRHQPMTLKSLVIAVVVSSLAVAQAPDAAISAKARQIHDSALIVDTHADTPQRFLDEGFDIGSTDPNDIGHISLDEPPRPCRSSLRRNRSACDSSSSAGSAGCSPSGS